MSLTDWIAFAIVGEALIIAVAHIVTRNVGRRP